MSNVVKLGVSAVINNQVPEFVLEENPVFLAFLSAYYEFLEQKGYSVDYIRNALTFLDVDSTLDNFVNYFFEEVKAIPLMAKADRRLLAKHIYDLYASKGTIKSYQLLFRILFGEEITIYLPKLDMLRISDGKWVIDSVMRTTNNIGDPFALSGLILSQTAIGNGIAPSILIENIVLQDYASSRFYDLFVNLASMRGVFRTGEYATAMYIDVNNIKQTVSVFIPPVPVVPVFSNHGSYYDVGDTVTLYDSTGVNFVSRVGQVGSGVVDNVLILDGGSNYTVGSFLTVDNTNTNGSGLSVRIMSVGPRGEVLTLSVINHGQQYISRPLVYGPTGNFQAFGKNIGSITQIDIVDPGSNYPNYSPAAQISSVGIVTTPVGTFADGETISILADSLDSENGYSLLLEDGTRFLNEVQFANLTTATVSTFVNNTLTFSGLIYNRDFLIEDATGRMALEDGTLFQIEISSADLRNRTIQGVTSGAICKVLHYNPADISFNIGAISKLAARYTNVDGKVSEASKKIQDSKFYQDFSYVIRSGQSIEQYRNIVHKLLHPAGLALFGEVEIATLLTSTLTLVSALSGEIKTSISTFLNLPLVSQRVQYKLIHSTNSISPGFTYQSLDEWKLQYKASPDMGIFYEPHTQLHDFGNLKFTDIYNYNADSSVASYKQTRNFYTRESQVSVKGSGEVGYTFMIGQSRLA